MKKALSFHFNTFNLCPNFSPEDLLAHKKKPSQLPLHGGPKAFAPDVDADDKILSSLLQEHGDVLQEQRVAKKYILLSSFSLLSYHTAGNKLPIVTWNLKTCLSANDCKI